MDLRLDGKVALVTGGSRGIGRAIAARFAASGARVMLSSRKPEALAEAAAQMQGPGGPVAWHAANVGDPDGAARCVAATVERFGSLDILVNNAATNPYYGPLVDIDAPRAEKTVQVNLEAALVWTQHAWRASMAERGGSVINMSSVGGFSVEHGIGWYNVTKAALAHLTRQLAYELGPGVRVNAIAPGLVRTDFARALWERAGDAVAGRLPLKRLGEPDDIAKAALFLASEAASWMTGQVLVVDGGALAMPSGGV
jgi:NAD(P)-dependent dehydrogenase (short-subunit alcohol dehydrogenase family)